MVQICMAFLHMVCHGQTFMYFVTDGTPWSDFLCILLQIVCHSLNLYLMFLPMVCHMIFIIFFTDGVSYTMAC